LNVVYLTSKLSEAAKSATVLLLLLLLRAHTSKIEKSIILA
jgi:hypothetical protein